MPSSVMQFDLVNDRKSFSFKFFPADPVRLTFSQNGKGEQKMWKTLNLGEKKKKEPYTKGYSHIKRTGGAHHTFRDGIKKVMGGWDFFQLAYRNFCSRSLPLQDFFSA